MEQEGTVNIRVRTGIQASFAVDYVFPTWHPRDAGGFVYQPLLHATAESKTGIGTPRALWA